MWEAGESGAPMGKGKVTRPRIRRRELAKNGIYVGEIQGRRCWSNRFMFDFGEPPGWLRNHLGSIAADITKVASLLKFDYFWEMKFFGVMRTDVEVLARLILLPEYLVLWRMTQNRGDDHGTVDVCYSYYAYFRNKYKRPRFFRAQEQDILGIKVEQEIVGLIAPDYSAIWRR